MDTYLVFIAESAIGRHRCSHRSRGSQFNRTEWRNPRPVPSVVTSKPAIRGHFKGSSALLVEVHGLSLELQELSAADFDLSLTGFEPGEIDGLLAIPDEVRIPGEGEKDSGVNANSDSGGNLRERHRTSRRFMSSYAATST